MGKLKGGEMGAKEGGKSKCLSWWWNINWGNGILCANLYPDYIKEDAELCCCWDTSLRQVSQ